MTIEPDWLTQVVELTTGRVFDARTAQALSTMLSDPAEVLPWLVLRQGAPDLIGPDLIGPDLTGLADDPAIMAALCAQADQIARRQIRHDPGFAVSALLVEIDRAVCDGLRVLVAEDVARAELAEEVHGLFVRRHISAAHGLDCAYRYRIGEPADH